MSQEILYTSAPQGLKPGSRGFCTVVRSENISRNLAERLESFSGYRHAFMGHEAGSKPNPVNYAHYRITLGGRRYHVLSRIADAGLDYTQRTNKLAHHVALEASEVAKAPGGPAWVMAAEGFFVARWDGSLGTTSEPRVPRQTDRPPGVCLQWEQLAGDAGWGGVLAEAGLGKGPPMSVIFPPGVPMLDLVVESLSLLPAAKRWEVTFSTYFTKAPAGVDCQWRFLLDGTPEAAALRRDVRAAIVDLTKRLGRAPGSGLVEAARTGVVSPRSASSRGAPMARTSSPPARGATAAAAQRENVWGDFAPPPPATAAFGRNQDTNSSWQAASRGIRQPVALFLAVLAGALLMTLGILVGALLFGGRYEVPPVEVATTPPEQSAEEPSVPPDTDSDATVPVPEDVIPDDSDAGEYEAEQDFEPAPPEPAVDETLPEEEEPEPPPPDPFPDLRDRQFQLRLPPRTVSVGSGALSQSGPNTEAVKLARLVVPNSQAVELQLGGPEFRPIENREPVVDVSDQRDTRQWDIDLVGTTTLSGPQRRPVARFRLEDGELWFNWREGSDQLRLEFCTLEISVDGQTRQCTLEFPVATGPTWQLNSGKSHSVDLSTHRLYRHDMISVDLQFRGIEDARFVDRATLNRELSTATLAIPWPSAGPDGQQPRVLLALTESGPPASGEDSPESRPLQALNLEPRFDANAWEFVVKEGGDAEAGVLIPAPDRRLKSFSGLTVAAIDEYAQEVENTVIGFRRQLANADERFRNWLRLPETERNEIVRFAEKSNRLDELESDHLQGEEQARLREELQNWPEGERVERQATTYRMLGEGPIFRARAENARNMNEWLNWQIETEQWAEAMREFFHTVHNQGRLDYRVYLRIEDRKVDLVISEGFGQPEEVEEPEELEEPEEMEEPES